MMTEQLRCAKHPNQETNLRCGRCERPICVRCLRYTSVGIRCRECATERRSGINAPGAAHVLRAVGTAAAIALILGALWGLFPTYAFWLALLLGFGGGEMVNLAANRRRGPELQTVAGAMVIGAFLLSLLIDDVPIPGHSVSLVFQTLMAALALWLAVVRQR